MKVFVWHTSTGTPWELLLDKNMDMENKMQITREYIKYRIYIEFLNNNI